MMRFLIFLLSIVFISSLTHADIFQCTDQAGKTIYKDKECQAGETLKNKIDITVILDKMNSSAPPADHSNPLGKNLLINASFENQLVDWKIPLGASWSSNQGSQASGVLIIRSEIPPEDEYIHETKIEQCVTLGPGEKFQLKGRFKAEKVLRGQYAEQANFANEVNIIWYETLNCSSGGQAGGYIRAKNVSGWQDLSVQNLIPAFQAIAAKISIVQNGRYSRAYKGYWDNISFAASEVFERSYKTRFKPDPQYTLALNKNYVKNGSFRMNLSSWRPWSAKWSSKGNASVGSAKITLKSKKGGMGIGVLNQCVNIGENTLFDFGASVRKDQRSSQSGGGRIRVSWSSKKDCKGRSKTDNRSADVDDVYGWQNLKIKNLAAPEATHSVYIEVIQSIAGPGKSSLFWDDIYFKAVRR